MFIKKLLLLLCFAASSPVLAVQGTNLIPDASFEAPVPVFFKGPGYYNYYLAKSKITDAPDGTHVLDVRAWNEKNTKVLSQPLEIPAGVITATVMVRALNTQPGSKLALALFDADSKKEISRFGEIDLTTAGQWKVLSGKITAPAGKVLLGLLPSGPSQGTILQLDELGLFAAATAGNASNRVDWQLIQGESLANGASWKTRPGSWGWYKGVASAGAMLDGSGKITAGTDLEVIKQCTVNYPGPHTLWIRTLQNRQYKGGFTVTLQQDNHVVASREIDSGDATLGATTGGLSDWVWVPLQADLQPGTVTVRLTRPQTPTSQASRKIDLLLLTNLPNYKPDEKQLRPRIYVRWSNTGQGQPYSLTTTAGERAGNLCATGFSRDMRVVDAKSIGPGENSPWSDLTPFLSPQRGVNKLNFVAARRDVLVSNPIKGILEFAVGDDKKVIRTVQIDQDEPRILFTLSDDFARSDALIETAYEYLKREQTAVAASGPRGQTAKYLDLVTTFYLVPGLDDQKLVDAELKNLTNLGFNGTSLAKSNPNRPKDINEFYRAHGMKDSFGWMLFTYYMRQDGDMTRPDIAKIDKVYQELAQKGSAFLPRTKRLIIADEPYGPSYEALVKSVTAQQKFRQFLQHQKVTLQDIGAASWDQVLPVTEKEKETNPELFYYSGMFRLQVAADLAKANVAEKKKYLPENVKTTADYSPPYSWVQQGMDPFLMQRNGGLEMGWSEDWHGYSASPEYTSDTYALLRAAGQGQPLGGYMVARYYSPLLKRIKYYTMVAGGARQICVYGYGPAYIGIDSWSETPEYYPVIHDVQFELGKIDGALNGTRRRPAQIAILYNRTAAIWSGKDSSAEQDARYIRWALSHAGYDADIIPEEDIVAGKLDQYKVLYMDGIQLRRDAAQKIAAWVQKGGILFGGAGAATRDEFNRPAQILESTFGVKSVNLQMVQSAGRPKYELRTRKVLDTLKGSNPETSALQFDQLCYSETLLPQTGAKVLFKDENGAVLGTQKTSGKGAAIRVAALPGLAYLNHAIRGKDYDINSYMPRDYDPHLRQFLSLPARLASVPQVAQSNLDSGEITRYDAPGRSVLFVINYAGNKKEDFSMLIPDANWATKATCANGAKVLLTKEANGMTRVSFPLNVAGAVVLGK